MIQRWEVTVVDRSTGKTHVTVEEVEPPMAQASAEVRAIKRLPNWESGAVRCTFSRFIGEGSAAR